jgi:hypothetical protein
MQSGISEGIAQQIVGKKFFDGVVISYDRQTGKLTTECARCKGRRTNVTLTNASQAVTYPQYESIICPHCKRTDTATKQVSVADIPRLKATPDSQWTTEELKLMAQYEGCLAAGLKELLRYNPNRRTAVQQYVIDELEAPQKAAATARSNVAENRELFVTHFRYTRALALSIYGNGYMGDIESKDVLKHPYYRSLTEWKALRDDERAILNTGADERLQLAGDANFMR